MGEFDKARDEDSYEPSVFFWHLISISSWLIGGLGPGGLGFESGYP